MTFSLTDPIMRSDGAPLTNSPTSRISLRWSLDLATPLAQWSRLTNGLVLTNGCLRFDQAVSEHEPAGYYSGVEEGK
jgi:hypothetical protein